MDSTGRQEDSAVFCCSGYISFTVLNTKQ